MLKLNASECEAAAAASHWCAVIELLRKHFDRSSVCLLVFKCFQLPHEVYQDILR